MNGGVFSCYDQLFSSMQPSENGTIQQEHDNMYFCGQTLSSDVPSPQQQQTGSHIAITSTTFNNPHIPFVQIHTTDVQPQRNYGNIFRRTVTNSQAVIKSEPIKSESADSGKERANATPTPPVRNTSCSSSELRIATPAVNQNVISQIIPDADPSAVVQTASNSKPFHSLNVYQCRQCRYLCLDEMSLKNHITTKHDQDGFLKNSDNNDQKILCPGCSNVFYALKSFEFHLLEDHFASLKDVNKMSEAHRKVKKAKECADGEKLPAQPRKSRIYLKDMECLREPCREPMDINGPANMHMTDSFFRSSNFAMQADQNVDLSDLLTGDFCTQNSIVNDEVQAEKTTTDECQSHSHSPSENIPYKPKQKISIKCVDVLREPALLRRDYEMQCNQYDAGEHQYDSFNIYQPVLPTTNSIPSCAVDSINNTVIGSNFTKTAAVSNLSMQSSAAVDNVELEKPRRPKIYIKNVDILKDPIMLPNFEGNVPALRLPESNAGLSGFSFLSTDYMNNTGNLATAIDDFDANGSSRPQIPTENYLYDTPSLNTNNVSNGNTKTGNEISLINSVERFATYNSGSGSSAPYLTYPPMIENDGIGSADTLSSSTTPITTEPTPPPVMNYSDTDPIVVADVQFMLQSTPPQQKQKIFIKNVDILKEPQFQMQRERGTLHLRTVDELNLMNRNEVESLIAPNLEHSTANNAAASLQMTTTTHKATIMDENEENTSKIHQNNDVMFCEEDTLKLQDYAAQLVSTWSSDDYDLGNDIDCIITDTMPESMNMLPLPPPANYLTTTKLNQDLETPQMSLISIRDIEELTGRNTLQSSVTENPSQCQIFEGTNVDVKESCVPKSIATALELEKAASAACNESPPPLAPVTTNTTDCNRHPKTIIRDTQTLSTTTNIALPPLVPVSSVINNSKSSNNTEQTRTITSTERGRIYVANNLVQVPSSVSNEVPLNSNECQSEETSPGIKCRKVPVVCVTGGTSVQGRPFGSNRVLNATKLNKVRAGSDEIVSKCSVRNCAFRFKKPETLAYHQRCHDSTKPTSCQAKVCPECNLKDFNNWNTLHTHLWRSHNIDMELYSCSVCQFKTPIYSRLVNTHSKIHSEERNYKCELCGKGFKNTKQLKNHRRWHRVASNNVATAKAKTNTASATTITALDDLLPTTPDSEVILELHRCKDCGSAFSHTKTLREHNCKKSDHQLSCKVCGHIASSKSALKLHLFTHENAKRLKCSHCTYSTSDHNAFRRHKMTHENAVMYECPHCTYKSIQSAAFQKHVITKHPEDASELIHKCKICTYSTVSRGLFALHQMKHETEFTKIP